MALFSLRLECDRRGTDGQLGAPGGHALMKGATAVTMKLDLSAGKVDLEAWFNGQLPGDRILGALFAGIECEGERKVPELNLDIRSVPKKEMKLPRLRRGTKW